MFIDPFPVARYRFRFRVGRPLRLHDYAGSALRGAFGHALKHIACVTQAPECKTCPLYRSCDYTAVFETPPPLDYARRKYSQIPNPFVIEPPAWGGRDYPAGAEFEFAMVLVGPALQHLTSITTAWQRAFRFGIGPDGGTGHMVDVHLESDGSAVMAAEAAGVLVHQPGVAIGPPPVSWQSVSLEFLTPLRLQRDGRILRPEVISARDLLMGMLRRTASFVEMHLAGRMEVDFAELNRRASGIFMSGNLRWARWTRYSHRQQQEMNLDGVIGRVQLEGDLAPFWPLLQLCQWLHVGKGATFGLGHYVMLTQPSTASGIPE
jgi:hypothetical protein